MMPGKKYKGLVTQKLGDRFVVDLFNSEGVLDWLEDIDPFILDLSDYPMIAEGAVIEFGKDTTGEFHVFTIQS